MFFLAQVGDGHGDCMDHVRGRDSREHAHDFDHFQGVMFFLLPSGMGNALSNVKSSAPRDPRRVFAGAGRVSSAPSGRVQKKCVDKVAGRAGASGDITGWALTTLYGVRDSRDELSKYPKYDYSRARADVAACAAGKALPHADKVVRFDKISRTARFGVSLFGTRLGVGSKREDERKYALMQYHGFTRREVDDPKLLRQIPYTIDMARKDIARARTSRGADKERSGAVRYRVEKYAGRVTDTVTGKVYTAGSGGYSSEYRYSAHGPRRASGERGKAVRSAAKWDPKFRDLSAYPLVDYQGKPYKSGPMYRRVPCSLDPQRLGCSGASKTAILIDEKSEALRKLGIDPKRALPGVVSKAALKRKAKDARAAADKARRVAVARQKPAVPEGFVDAAKCPKKCAVGQACWTNGRGLFMCKNRKRSQSPPSARTSSSARTTSSASARTR